MTVLIVDDEPLVRRSFERCLRPRGHVVFLAENGRDGLEAWRQHSPDLIFLDVLMPGMTGPQVLESLGPTRRGFVVLMTAYAGESNNDFVQKYNVDLFVEKPFDDILKLIAKVESLVGDVDVDDHDNDGRGKK